jgi:hypothetical protein
MIFFWEGQITCHEQLNPSDEMDGQFLELRSMAKMVMSCIDGSVPRKIDDGVNKIEIFRQLQQL